MFRKLVISVVLLTLAMPGIALAQQYPPTSTTEPGVTTTTQPGVTTTTQPCPPAQPCPTTTTQPCPPAQPCPTTTTQPCPPAQPCPTSTTKVDDRTTTTKGAIVVPPDGPGRTGALPRTGADTIALLVRIGMALLVAGFIFGLAERNRRAARAGGAGDGGSGIA